MAYSKLYPGDILRAIGGARFDTYVSIWGIQRMKHSKDICSKSRTFICREAHDEKPMDTVNKSSTRVFPVSSLEAQSFIIMKIG